MNFPPPFRSLHSSLFIVFQYLPSPFNTFRRLSLPFIAFQYLSSPFITFRRLSILQYLPSPFIIFHRRPISLSAHSLLPRFALASPHSLTMPLYPRLAPFCPRLAPFCPHLAPFCPHHAPLSHHATLSSPRPTLSPCPRIPPLHTCFPPASSPPLFHTSVFHAPLSAPLCFTPSIVLHPVVFYFLPLCFALSRCFASFVLLPPPLLYSLPLFCTRFFTPRQPPQTRPRHRKKQRFSHFSKKFCKKPLTKQKKVLY